VLLVDASSFITLAEADAEYTLFERQETIWVPEHVTYEITEDPAKTKLRNAIQSGDIYIDATDHRFRTHFRYYRAASFHLNEKTPFIAGEFHWSGDAALVGRALSMEEITLVSDDGPFEAGVTI